MMEGEVLDMDGWPIMEDARVYVPPRPGPDGVGEVTGFGALVTSVTPERVDMEELLSFNHRTVRPDQVRVQSGETQGSLEHRAIRKGGRQFLASRVNQIRVREERAARKVAEEEGEA